MPNLNKFRVMLILLTLALTACQSNLPKPTAVLKPQDEKQSKNTQESKVTYSQVASQNIETWQKLLMSTELMQDESPD